VKVRLSNKFWARHLMDTVAMWLKCNRTPPFGVDSGPHGSDLMQAYRDYKWEVSFPTAIGWSLLARYRYGMS
jgi:hypothetical protein